MEPSIGKYIRKGKESYFLLKKDNNEHLIRLDPLRVERDQYFLPVDNLQENANYYVFYTKVADTLYAVDIAPHINLTDTKHSLFCLPEATENSLLYSPNEDEQYQVNVSAELADAVNRWQDPDKEICCKLSTNNNRYFLYIDAVDTDESVSGFFTDACLSQTRKSFDGYIELDDGKSVPAYLSKDLTSQYQINDIGPFAKIVVQAVFDEFVHSYKVTAMTLDFQKEGLIKCHTNLRIVDAQKNNKDQDKQDFICISELQADVFIKSRLFANQTNLKSFDSKRLLPAMYSYNAGAKFPFAFIQFHLAAEYGEIIIDKVDQAANNCEFSLLYKGARFVSTSTLELENKTPLINKIKNKLMQRGYPLLLIADSRQRVSLACQKMGFIQVEINMPEEPSVYQGQVKLLGKGDESGQHYYRFQRLQGGGEVHVRQADFYLFNVGDIDIDSILNVTLERSDLIWFGDQRYPIFLLLDLTEPLLSLANMQNSGSYSFRNAFEWSVKTFHSPFLGPHLMAPPQKKDTSPEQSTDQQVAHEPIELTALDKRKLPFWLKSCAVLILQTKSSVKPAVIISAAALSNQQIFRLKKDQTGNVAIKIRGSSGAPSINAVTLAVDSKSKSSDPLPENKVELQIKSIQPIKVGAKVSFCSLNDTTKIEKYTDFSGVFAALENPLQYKVEAIVVLIKNKNVIKKINWIELL
jgi:hypothetical protein